jgi:hypothetical protein
MRMGDFSIKRSSSEGEIGRSLSVCEQSGTRNGPHSHVRIRSVHPLFSHP